MGAFGSKLREARMLRGLTQEQLAERADISRVMIGRYETTDQMPALDTLVRLADALEVSADYLLLRTDAPDALLTARPAEAQHKQKSKAAMPRTVAELEAVIRRVTAEVLAERHLMD